LASAWLAVRKGIESGLQAKAPPRLKPERKQAPNGKAKAMPFQSILEGSAEDYPAEGTPPSLGGSILLSLVYGEYWPQNTSAKRVGRRNLSGKGLGAFLGVS
jgi:hypothetical protein